ncbi:MAG: hypothetical protein BWY82_01363 [Verrucomicrobia bacterium ADurb.Bin474]|nr:MAG: hypothetical protein BWY82_01363 [Verrucomicrobia bacterium ADurb.Bin474]
MRLFIDTDILLDVLLGRAPGCWTGPKRTPIKAVSPGDPYRFILNP